TRFSRDWSSDVCSSDRYAVGENMTIDLLLPKGVIQPPDEATLSEWWYHDHGSTIAAATTILLSALLAFVLWFLFGRDPRPGVIRSEERRVGKACPTWWV